MASNNHDDSDRQTSRRDILISAGALFVTVSGCDKITDGAKQVDKSVESTVQSASTTTLRNAKLALRGYEIVSFLIAKRVVMLPMPGARIVAATLVVSAVGAKLVVDYIDEELIVRKYEEKLTPEERTSVETQGFVRFRTESGKEEDVYLGPTEYVD